MKLKYVKTTGVRKPETKGNYDYWVSLYNF